MFLVASDVSVDWPTISMRRRSLTFDSEVKLFAFFVAILMRTMRKLVVIVHNIEKGEWELGMLKNHDVAKGWQY